MNYIKNTANKITPQKWALLVIILIGIFLRTYHFKDWILVASDQARDLTLVGKVINNHAAWPLLGPDMSGAGGFMLGPIYYYFQIISAKIFGLSAASQAYPDLLFSILSIPLLYYFLKRFFTENAAIFSTSIYAVSYFAVEYSRFSWNVNLIPFFVLLFLLSFWEFLIQAEKTPFKWVVLAGVALGVGVQLHAILLLLLPAVSFCIFIFLSKDALFFARSETERVLSFHSTSLKNNLRFWRKFAIIIAIALTLNFGQFINEQKTNFGNTRAFLNAFVFKSARTGGSTIKSLELDVACNARASALAISSLGNKNICDFLYDGERSTTYNSKIRLSSDPLLLLGEFFSLIFLFVGCWFLTHSFCNEQNEKRKKFLGIILLYSALYFLVMIPIAPGSRMRYYLPIIFLPFVFLSFLFDYLAKKYPQKYIWIIAIIFFTLIFLNFNSLLAEVDTLSSGIKIDFTKI